VIHPFRAEFLLSDDGYWTGPNDLQGDGSRYVKGPRGNRLVGINYGGLANAENRVENNEMGGYESPFITRLHVLDLMRRLAGDENRAASVTMYLDRRMVGGVIRLGWDKDKGVYVPRSANAGCLAAFNRHYASASQPAAKARVATYLEQLRTYYARGDLDPAVRKRLDQARKGLYNAYMLALCEDPDDLPDPPEQATRPPILKTMFKYVVTPDTAIVKHVIATDLDGDDLTVTVAGLPDGAAFDAAAREITWTPTEADLGVHIVTVTVSDHATSVTKPFPIIVKAKLGVGPVPGAPKAAKAELGEDGRSIRISWTPPADDVDVAAYVVYRDGALWAATDAETTRFVDTERVVPASHTRYHVAVYSTIGAESGATAAAPNPIFIDR